MNRESLEKVQEYKDNLLILKKNEKDLPER